MESLYYYADIGKAASEICRVLQPVGLFVTVVDLYKENPPTHQWIETLKVPVHCWESKITVGLLRKPALKIFVMSDFWIRGLFPMITREEASRVGDLLSIAGIVSLMLTAEKR